MNVDIGQINNGMSIEFTNRLPVEMDAAPTTLFIPAKTVYFVSNDLPDLTNLVAAIPQDASIHFIDGRADVITQLRTVLSGYIQLDAIHLLCHGEPAQMQLGGQSITIQTLHDRAADLNALGASLASDGSFFLYACQLAQGTRGEAFIEKWASITGCTVAASNTLTGARNLGADWDLQYQTAPISQSHLQATAWMGAMHTDSVGFVLVPDAGKSTYTVYVYYGSWHSGNASAVAAEGDLALYTAGTGLASNSYGYSTSGLNHLAYGVGANGVIASSDPYAFARVAAGNNPFTFPNDTSSNAYTTASIQSIGFTPGTNYFWTNNTGNTAKTANSLVASSSTVSSESSVYSHQVAHISGLSAGTYRISYDPNSTIAPANFTQNWQADGNAIGSLIFTINGNGTVQVQGGPPALYASYINSPTTYTLGASSSALDANIAVSSSSGIWSAKTLVVTVSSHLDSTHDALAVLSGAFGSLITVSGTSISYNGTAFATIGSTGHNGVIGSTDLAITFTAAATTTMVQALTDAISFSSTSGGSILQRGVSFAVTDSIATSTVTDLINVSSTPPPAAPTGLSLAGASDSGVSSDGITNILKPTITGTAAANSAVTLYDTDGVTVIGTATANGSGAWSITPASNLTQLTHSFTAKATVGGLTGNASTVLPVTIDATAPLFQSGTVGNTKLVLSYSESGSGIAGGDVPTPAEFIVRDATSSTTIAVSSVSVDPVGQKITLTLASSIQSAHAITVTYTADGTVAHEFQDIAGNLAANLSAQSITNTTSATTPPTALALAIASDTGLVTNDAKTDLTMPTITGTATANATIILYDENGVQIGTGTANGSGAWSVAITSALADGTHNIAATATVSGVVSSTSANLAVTVDATAPLLNTAKVNGAQLVLTYVENGSGIASGAIPTASEYVITDAGSTDTVTNVVVNTTAKTVTLTLASAIHSGDVVALNYTHDITATHQLQDVAGNLAANLTNQAVTNVTVTAPSALDLSAASDSGLSHVDNITNVTTPSIVGSAPANSLVTLYDTDGTTVLGTTTADGSGAWSIATLGLASGAHTLSATAAINGVMSTISSTLQFSIDTVAPAISSAKASGTQIVLGYTESGSGIASGAVPIAGEYAVTVGGIADTVNAVSLDANAKTVTLTLATAAHQGDAIALSYTHDVTATHQLQDVAGNLAANLSAQVVTNNTTSVSSPMNLALASGSDTGLVTTDGIIKLATPTITGTSDANAAIALYDSDGITVIGTGTANGSGQWSIATSALTTATHQISAVATVSAASSAHSTSLPVSVDLIAPVLTPSTATINGSQVVLHYTEGNSGIAAGGIPIAADYVVNNGSVDAVTAVAVNTAAKTVTLSLTNPVQQGDAVSIAYTSDGVVANNLQDLAGNLASSFSISTGASTLTNTTVAPSAPSGLSLDAGSDTGVTGDNTTNLLHPTIDGNAPAGSTVLLYQDGMGAPVQIVTADINGIWSTQLTGALIIEGDHTFTAKTSVGGVLSVASSTLHVISDTVSPVLSTATISGTQLVLTYAELGSGLTTNDIPVGDEYVVMVGGVNNPVTMVQVDPAANTVTLTLTSSAVNGDAVTVAYVKDAFTYDQLQDAAGNTAADLPTTVVTNLTTGVPSPDNLALGAGSDTGLSSSDGQTSVVTPSITGTSAANAAITLYDTDGTTVLGTTTSDANGNWGITTTTLAQGHHTLSAVATIGGHSSAPTNLTVVIDTVTPVLASGTVNANQIVLTYTESGSGISTGGLPTAAEYVVTDAGTADAITGIVLDATANTITLSLANAVQGGDAVRLSYTADGTGANELQDVAGNLATNLSSQTLTNNTPVAAPVNGGGSNAPVIHTAEVTSNTLTLNYSVSNSLLAQANLSTSNFQVHIGNQTISVTGAHIDPLTNMVTLTLAAPVLPNTHPTVSYIAPSTPGATLQDILGNTALTALNHVVTNNTPVVATATGPVSELIQLYQAAYGRAPDAGGLQYWSDLLSKGTLTATQLSSTFINQMSEFSQVNGSSSALTDQQFINLVYHNALNIAPDAITQAALLTALHNGESRSQLMLDVAMSPSSLTYSATNGQQTLLYSYLSNQNSVGVTVITTMNANVINGSGTYNVGSTKEITVLASGNVVINGGASIDTVVAANTVLSQSNLTVTHTDTSTSHSIVATITVAGTDAPSTLNNIDRLFFTDTSVALDTSVGQNAGEAYRLYQAAFNRTADTSGLGYWINALDNGSTLTNVANDFVNSAEFKAAFGSSANAQQLVTQMYTNILGRAPDATGAAYWVNQLQSGSNTAQVLASFSESVENVSHTAAAIGQGVNYQQFIA